MATYEQQLFLDELSTETERVLSSRQGLWVESLSRWFDVIDSDMEAREAVGALEEGANFDEWHKEHYDAWRNDHEEFLEKRMAQIRFPRDRRQSLGIRLRLFRAILDGKFDTPSFCLHYLGVYTEQDIVTTMSKEIFSPMVHDLKKYLTEYIESPDKIIPAADRIVPLDHNSVNYMDTIKAAEEFREELSKTNIELEDKGRLVAEVSAGIELLRGPSVNTRALRATLVKGAKYVADKAAGATIAVLAAGLLGMIARLIGLV